MDHSMEDNMNDLVIDSTEDFMDYSMDYNGTPEQRVASEDPVSNRTVRTSTRLVIVDLHEVKDGKADFDLNHLTLTASATRGNSTRLYIDLVIPTDSRTGPLGWYDEEPCRWLYGVQQLGWLGFVNLQELVLDLAAFGGDDSGVRDGQLCAGWQNMIADWVRDRVVAFGVAKRSIEIRINGVQWQKWDLPEALQEQASRPHFYRDRSLPYSRDDQCESPPPPRRASF
ncbi:hypothetical protein LTS16_004946 [Friedmanniomyces endolithicus]|nr:hypothetical protein LTR57_008961 [Friedmanniomyces endolithicus]KAK0995012.1 hypothetical protein LTS01_006943 [Friedmanniomyces endolithicus]KAK1047788.1 hypothetical protein LTS16_004946 [Friedmanniomyces endolithicus]KAK1081638.1 hypothetical protein LTR33_004520 [Friedmanniomyces endolithicus]